MKGVRVFVSGGAGVIGHEIIPKLVDRGAEVFVGDLKQRPKNFVPGVRYRQGDLNKLTKAELASFEPDIFIHLAATFERSTESPGFWDENFHHNVALSHHLMTIMQDVPSLRRVVFASSYLIYDPVLYQFDSIPRQAVSLDECDPILPRNLVGMAKLSHEMELRFLAGLESSRFSALSVRIYRGYGCNSRDVISRWIRALLAGEPITVFRPEGQFDYIYAADSAEGLIRLAENEKVQGVINLGTGKSRRVADVVDILRQTFPAIIVNHVDSDIPYEASQANIDLLRSSICWTPEYDIETAIPEIIEYERKKEHSVESLKPVACNFLVTSAARKVPLVRAMKIAAAKIGSNARVIAGDVDSKSPTRLIADEFWTMPLTVPEHAEMILDECRARDITLIIPTRDGELKFWADVRKSFLGHGITVAVSDTKSVERCLDKLQFAQFGEQTGLPVISATEHLDDLDNQLFVVKERFGAGSKKIGLRLDRKKALAHSNQLDQPIYQPFVEGQEISIDAWMNEACEPRGVVLRRRDKVVNGESQVTTTFRDSRIEALAMAALTALQLRGPAVVQAIIDSVGRIWIIECNARFGGASTAAITVGLDMLYWSMLEGCQLETKGPFKRIEGEIKQERVPMDIIVHDPDF
ncbi:MAG: NAD-dependent epimerase/dehydratase family protein [Halioglobus sp.]